MPDTKTLEFIRYVPTIPATHPPRLSGFNREAQPWRVFYACFICKDKLEADLTR